MSRTIQRLLMLLLLVFSVGCDGHIDVFGRVLDGAGDGVAGIEVHLGHLGESLTFDGETDAEGCFAIGGMVGPGQRDYLLTVSAAGYEPVESTFTSSGEYPILVHLDADASGQIRIDRIAQAGSLPPELDECSF